MAPASWETYAGHSYLRIHPELRKQVDGPHTQDEPGVSGERHPLLRGFEETDILPFGGRLERVTVQADSPALLTWIPPFPIYPPETAWMREPSTGQAALVAHMTNSGGRVVYLAADIDRCYARHRLPDHGDLLGNAVRWATQDHIPLRVAGKGLLDCHLYYQPRPKGSQEAARLILHLVNLSSTGFVPVDELLPIGPLQVEIQLPAAVRGATARALVAGHALASSVEQGAGAAWVRCDVPTITDHEVVVVE